MYEVAELVLGCEVRSSFLKNVIIILKSEDDAFNTKKFV